MVVHDLDLPAVQHAYAVHTFFAPSVMFYRMARDMKEYRRVRAIWEREARQLEQRMSFLEMQMPAPYTPIRRLCEEVTLPVQDRGQLMPYRLATYYPGLVDISAYPELASWVTDESTPC